MYNPNLAASYEQSTLIESKITEQEAVLTHLPFRCVNCTEKRDQVLELIPELQIWANTAPYLLEAFTEDKDPKGLVQIAQMRACFTVELRHWMQQW